jgi:hypothetical protein
MAASMQQLATISTAKLAVKVARDTARIPKIFTTETQRSYAATKMRKVGFTTKAWFDVAHHRPRTRRFS